jgi:hypothetical protein
VSSPGKVYDSADLATLLAPALGYERADHVVRETLTRLGFSTRGLSTEQATRVLEMISTMQGVVGIAGRFALARAPREAMSTSGAFRSAVKPMSVGAVVELFVPSVGKTKATEVVEEALQKLQIRSNMLSSTEVAAVLELLVNGTGIVATVARFARARLLLG